MRRILAVLLLAGTAATGLSVAAAPAGAAVRRGPFEVVTFRGNCTRARALASRSGARVEREPKFCEVERQIGSLSAARAFARRHGGSVEAS
jgi:hypothetical protein